MLKRKTKIKKYIKALKHKKKLISDHPILQHKLEDLPQQVQLPNGFKIPSYSVAKNEQIQEEEPKNLWHDSDDDEIAELGNRNTFKKLNLSEEPTQRQYEGKLKLFYNKKYSNQNWAVEGEGQHEKDVADLMNEEEVYDQGKQRTKESQIQFLMRGAVKHDSIITGLDWKGKILASCGYDQKLKIWSLRRQEENPQLKFKIQKDIYTEKYALSGCYFNHNELYLSTLRQNYLIFDAEKQSLKHQTSSYLSESHKTYQNMRLSESHQQFLMFSGHKMSIMSTKNQYMGGLIANDTIVDASFGVNSHNVWGISDQGIYEWDLRMYKCVKYVRKCLGYTKLAVKGNTLAIGNKLGIVTLHHIKDNKQIQEYCQLANLVTHISELKLNPSGDKLLSLSKWKQNAARLSEVNRGKCIQGWPNNQTKLQFATVGQFSNNGEVAIGNSKGFVNVYSVTN